MVLTNEPLDLIDKEIDVALRVGNLPDSNLVARKLAVFRTQVYASPDYIARHGEPLHPDDLQHHRTLAMQKSRRNGSTLLAAQRRHSARSITASIRCWSPTTRRALSGALLCGEGLMLAAT